LQEISATKKRMDGASTFFENHKGEKADIVARKPIPIREGKEKMSESA